MKTNKPSEFQYWLKNPPRAVFGHGADVTVCSPDALKPESVPAEMRLPEAEVQKALAALTLDRG